jgi:hypothetical protein
MKNRAILFCGAVMALLGAAASAYAQPASINGAYDPAFGSALSLQTDGTGFGANQSELDAAYGFVTNGNLYLFLSGNLEAAGNNLNLFISGVGGQSTLSAAALPGTSETALNSLSIMNSSVFSSGFTAIYAININATNVLNVSQYNLLNNTAVDALGTNLTESGNIVSNITVDNGVVVGFNDNNTQTQTNNVGTGSLGMELKIPLSLIGNPSGSIKVMADINGSLQGFLSNQFFPGLPGGTGNVGGGGTYTGGGSGDFNFSTTAGEYITIPAPVDDTISLSSSANPSFSGSNVTFTATVQTNGVTAGNATANMVFYTNGTPVATNAVVSGSASYTTTYNLPVGNNTIQAIYTGDVNYPASTNSLTQIVSGIYHVSLSSSLNPSILGSNVTFTATFQTNGVTAGNATANMVFYTNGTVAATVAAVGGSASYATNNLPVGNNTIQAVYVGDVNYPATTNSLTQTVLAQIVVGPTNINGAYDPSFGSALALQTDFTGFGNSAGPNGNELDAAYGLVTNGNLYLFFTGDLQSGNNINLFIAGVGGQSTVNAVNPGNLGMNDLAGLDSSQFSPGFLAIYGFNFTSGSEALTVSQYNLVNNTAVDTLGNLTETGNIVTNATVDNSVVVGFNNNNTEVQSDTSGAVPNNVGPGSLGLEMKIPLSLIGNPSGSVKVLVDINGSLEGYMANQFLPGMPFGTGNFGGGGTYSDDVNASNSGFNFSSLSGEYITVPAPVNDTISLSSSANPSTYGSNVTFTAAVQTNGVTAGNATANMVFYSNGTPVATNAVVSGSASYTTVALTAGNITVKAIYVGDANYPTSTNSLIQTVNPLAVTLSGSGTYNGTATMAAGNLSVGNVVGGDNLTLSGTAVLAARNAGSQALVNMAGSVQSATGSVGSSAASSFTVTLAAPANGDTLIAVISTRGTNSSEVSSMSQSGVTWTRASQSVNAKGTTTEIWYAPNVSGAGTTVTVNLAASLFASAVVAEYSGAMYASPLDQTATNNGNGIAADTGTTATTSQGNELWIGGIGLANSGYTLGTLKNSFTAVNNAASTGSQPSLNSTVYALQKIVSATGTADSGGTVSGTNAIALRGSPTTGTNIATTLTINAPTGLAAGDVMIANICQSGSSSSTNVPVLSGWTLVTNALLRGSSTTNIYGSLLYRVATSSDSGSSSYAFTLTNGVSDAVGAIVAFSGVDNTTPFDVAPVAIKATNSANVTVVATSITTVSTNDAVIMFGMAAAASATTPTWATWKTATSPGALRPLYTNWVFLSATTNASIGAAWATNATAGATGAGSVTLGTAEVNGGILIALRPASQQWSGAMATFKTGLGSSLTLGGSAAANYTLAGASGSVTVTAKALTVSGITAPSTTYSGTNTATLGGTAAFQSAEAPGTGTTSDGIPYTVDSVSAGGTAAGTLASRNVGNEAVTVTGVTVTGTGNGNYSATQQTGLTQNVTPKPLTAAGTLVAQNKPYDGTTNATLTGSAALLTAESPGSGSTSDNTPYTGDTVSVTGTAIGTFVSANIGNNIAVNVSGLSLNGAQDGDYSLTEPTLSADITQAGTSIALSSSLNPSGFNASVSFTASGLPTNATGSVVFLTNSVTFDTETLSTGSVTSAATTLLPSGTNLITAEYGGDTNYLGSTNTLNQIVTNVNATSSIVSIISGNPTTLTANGIPRYVYVTQRATNLVSAVWVNIATNTAASNGVISVTDNFSDLGNQEPANAYYRLSGSPSP